MKDFAKSIVCNTKASNALFPPSKYDDEIHKLEMEYMNLGRSGGNPSEILGKQADIEKKIQHLKELRRKEVGNTRTGNINYSGIKEFKSESELRRWCMDHNYTYTPTHGGYYRLEDDKPGSHRPNIEAHVRQGQETGNTKVGNGITKFGLGKYVIADGHKAIVLGEKEERGPNGIPFGWVTIRWVEGPWKGQSDQYYDYDLKKTGNDTPWEYAHRKPKVINDDKTGAEEFFKQLSDDVKEREDKDDADIEKVGNKVVWKEGPYRIEEVEKDGKFGFYNIPKGSFNAYRNSVLYGNFKTLDSAKAKMNEEIRLDKEYNRKYTTNSKTGNTTPNYRYKDFLITNPEGHEYIVFLKDGRTVGYRGTTSKAQAEDWCDWHDPKTGKSIGNKVGNSAQDDKFAYVMREFDEGKLKTPDGKVVTDPAQAKAIAYSESKKTENGLARARNAIKKS